MTPFDRLDRIASRAVDWLNAQTFVLIPMRGDANRRRLVDPSRPRIEGKGVFDYASVEKGLQLGVRKTYREANDLQTLQIGREPILSIDRTVYFPDANSLPRQGDIIQIPEDAGQPDFEIVSAQPDGQSRILLKLNIRGAP